MHQNEELFESSIITGEQIETRSKTPDFPDRQQNDEQNYNINVPSQEPIEEHKSSDVCRYTTGSMKTSKTNKTKKKPYSALRNSEKEEQKCKILDRGLNRTNNVVNSSLTKD